MLGKVNPSVLFIIPSFNIKKLYRPTDGNICGNAYTFRRCSNFPIMRETLHATGIIIPKLIAAQTLREKRKSKFVKLNPAQNIASTVSFFYSLFV